MIFLNNPASANGLASSTSASVIFGSAQAGLFTPMRPTRRKIAPAPVCIVPPIIPPANASRPCAISCCSLSKVICIALCSTSSDSSWNPSLKGIPAIVRALLTTVGSRESMDLPRICSCGPVRRPTALRAIAIPRPSVSTDTRPAPSKATASCPGPIAIPFARCASTSLDIYPAPTTPKRPNAPRPAILPNAPGIATPGRGTSACPAICPTKADAPGCVGHVSCASRSIASDTPGGNQLSGSTPMRDSLSPRAAAPEDSCTTPTGTDRSRLAGHEYVGAVTILLHSFLEPSRLRMPDESIGDSRKLPILFGSERPRLILRYKGVDSTL